MTAHPPVPPPVPPPYRPQHTGPHTYRPQHTNGYPVPYINAHPPAQTQYLPPYIPTVTSTPHVIRGDRNGLGVAGLVLGIVALCFAVLPIVGLIAWVLWPLGAIFSGVGISRANQAIATNRNVAVAGLCCSLAAGAVCIGWVVFTAVVTSGAH